MTYQEQIEKLEQQLTTVNTVSERLNVLVELSSFLLRVEPEQARIRAAEALALAERVGYTGYIIRALYHLGNAVLAMGNMAEALRYGERVLELCREDSDTGLTERARHLLASVYTENRQFDKALELLFSNLRVYEAEQNTVRLAHTLNAIATVCNNIGEFADSLHFFLQAISLLEPMQPRDFALSSCYHNLAMLYIQIDDVEKACETFERSLDLRRELGDVTGKARTLEAMGGLFHLMEREGEALTLLLQAKELMERCGLKRDILRCFNSLGGVYCNMDLMQDGLRCFTRALALAREFGDGQMCAYISGNFGRAYQDQEQFDKAVIWFEQALEQATAINDTKFEYMLAKELAETYEQLGDAHKALAYQKMFVEKKEQILGAERQRALAAEQVKFVLQREQAKTEQYRREKEQLAGEVESKTKELTSTSLDLARKNEFLKQVKKQLRDLLHARRGKTTVLRQLLEQVQHNVASEQEWKNFERHFEHAHDEFLARLAQSYPALSKTELKICALLKAGMSTKDIAQLLCVSVRTVEYHRGHIRSKLGISGRYTLATFLTTI